VSSPTEDLALTMGWLREGTALFLGEVDGLSDADLVAPSLLPDWTRAHVIGHVARNADAIGRLLSWARTGVEQRMYPSREARAAEIEATAAVPPDVLRADVRATSAEVLRAVEEMPPERWGEQVRTARGGAAPAARLPWLRVREVWIHAVDLDGGARFAQLPPPVCALLVDDVVAEFAARDAPPSLTLVAVDTGRTWTLGDGDQTVEAPLPELAAWLTGRTRRRDIALPRWL
jgi:maleylpyruvate isomerase